jgi:hypothetical protein
VPILHDFAYAAIGSAASDAPLSLFSQPDAKAWGVETYTFSKTFNMAGWRFGFAVGNASIIRAFKKLHTHSYSTVFGAIQDAAIAALNLPAERIAQLTAVYHQRREWVLRRLAALRWPARAAQGTFFLWLGVPPGYRSQEFARLLLQEAHILVAPGTGFGEGGRVYSHQPDRRGRRAEQRAGPSCPAGAVLVRRREKQKRNPGRGDYSADESITDSTILPSDDPAPLARAPSAPAQGENAVNRHPDDPGVQQVGKPGELRAAGAYLGGGDRHSALSRLFRPGKAERKDRVQRAAGPQGTQKTAAGRPARRIDDQIQVTHRLLNRSGRIVDNASAPS